MRKNCVAILTWHYYINFGSALQTYALQESIKDLGYDPKIINYRNTKFGKVNKTKDRIKSIVSEIFEKLNICSSKFYYPFLLFQKEYFRQTRLIQDEALLPSLCNKFDIIVCGSDQIWAPNVFNPLYMLDFVPSNKKKISYAASIGLNDIPDDLIVQYKNLLSSFDKISVRETLGSELLKKKCGVKAQVVIDPTLMLDVSKWKRIEKPLHENIKDKFIFCYFLKNDHKYKDSVLDFARKNRHKIIGYSTNIVDNSWMDNKLENIGPQEFLWLIHNASVVITDSYHGTAFSLLYHKNFITLERFKNEDKICQNSRINQLKYYFNLENQIVNNSTKKKLSIEKLDYDDFDKKLSELRKSSLNYLNSSLEG